MTMDTKFVEQNEIDPINSYSCDKALKVEFDKSRFWPYLLLFVSNDLENSQ